MLSSDKTDDTLKLKKKINLKKSILEIDTIHSQRRTLSETRRIWMNPRNIEYTLLGILLSHLVIWHFSRNTVERCKISRRSHFNRVNETIRGFIIFFASYKLYRNYSRLATPGTNPIIRASNLVNNHHYRRHAHTYTPCRISIELAENYLVKSLITLVNRRIIASI